MDNFILILRVSIVKLNFFIEVILGERKEVEAMKHGGKLKLQKAHSKLTFKSSNNYTLTTTASPQNCFVRSPAL